jgi:hypothetical protein
MEKQKDSGYPVNVTSLVKLIKEILSFGARYNPTKFSIKLENLNDLLNRIKLSLKAVDAAKDVKNKASEMREKVFKELEVYVTRLVGAVGSCDILPGRVEKFASLVRKFRGVRATPPASSKVSDLPDGSAPEETKTYSTAQTSFVRKEDNFSEIVTFLEGEPNYQTNEMELTISAIQAMMSELVARNDAVSAAEAQYFSALIARDKLFFSPPDGLVPCSKAVKSYVKSAFKASSPEFKKVSGIPFTNKKKKK